MSVVSGDLNAKVLTYDENVCFLFINFINMLKMFKVIFNVY